MKYFLCTPFFTNQGDSKGLLSVDHIFVSVVIDAMVSESTVGDRAFWHLCNMHAYLMKGLFHIDC
ncbi:hypothetical protein FDUTEX481_04478 [Tolypothrix sp. PCC 7601]|nr:hypothetical protein FDUTEX481_04478 [Tolypothrix sp. PCC 7601]BAU04550.1 unknown protein [Fischerella sp. NIES-3754]BAY95155.1 hypothetical protein NIES3275_72120 [Microchaete diplosiphon NIES-3275]